MEIFSFSTDRIEFKSEDGNDYIVGYVSTHDRDIVNDIVTKNCMMDMLDQFKKGNLKLDLEHETLRGDTKLEKKMNITKVPLAVSVDALYDGKGLMVKFKMNKKYKKLDSKEDIVYNYDDVKSMVKDGSLDSFSIAYIAEDTIDRIEDDGIKARLLDKIRWINTALTGNPINRGSKMVDIMMKSLDSAESKPFAGYSSFQDCVNKNRDKNDPKAYCASIMRKVEGKEESMEKKAYSKDGGHAHTSESPIGEHNHPEIENAIERIYGYMDERIEKIQPVKEESSIIMKGGKNMDKETKDKVQEKEEKKDIPENVQESEELKDNKKDKEEPKLDVKALGSKIDGMINDMAAFKSVIEEQKKSIDALKKEMEEMKAIADKPVFSAKAGNSEDTKIAEKKAIENLDPLAFV